ncbi:hypothetical protein S40293_09023 [Stachybotrys chartarum IBT 40293]|nr:hypothetical protein S40293_09023 [Stachybotrys chartarum IBT 40293]
MSSSPTYSSGSSSWQERLEEVCRDAQLRPPVFQIVSDRRGKYNTTEKTQQWRLTEILADATICTGGRTAWSSRVTVHGKTLAARYWYDGKNLHNAREDAAECALNWLTSSSGGSPVQTWATW